MTGMGRASHTTRVLFLLTALLLALLVSPASAGVRPTGHLFWVTEDMSLHVVAADGSASHLVRLPTRVLLGDLAVDRSRTRVAFTLTRSDTSLPELWVLDARLMRPRQLTAAVFPSAPSWSPDGRRLVYVSAEASLRVIDVAGNDDRAVLPVPGIVDDPEWGPRGVVYAHNVGVLGVGGVALELVDVDALMPIPRVLAPLVERTMAPHWSPDGRKVSYLLPAGLYVVDVVTGTSRRLTTGGDPSFAGGAPWAPDGRAMLLCRPVAGWFGLGGQPLREVDSISGRERQVGEGACLTPTWSPDGTFTAVVDASGDESTHLIVRDRRGHLLRDLGPAWGVGVVWTRA